MHELSIVHQLTKTVDDIKEENNFKQVQSITLQIGEMSDVIPDYLTQAWLAAKDSLGYKDTQLNIEVITARAKCTDCGFSDDVRNLPIQCPRCANTNFKIISGKEFLIKEICAK